MSRYYNNWLLEWSKLFVGTEVPETYTIWTGLWTIAAVLQDHVALQRGGHMMYPNMYILLIGPPRGGKSYTGKIALESMIEPLGVETWAGSMSASFLAKYLDGIALRLSLQSVNAKPCLTFYSDELALTVGSGEAAAEVLRIMTQLYDFRFDYGTHKHGAIHTQRPLINWLACATMRWLRRSVPGDLVDSGFVARLIAQVDTLSDAIVPELPELDKERVQRLQADLVNIALLSGTYELSPEASEAFKDWYIPAATQRRALRDEIAQGIYGREDEQILKVALCLTAACGEDTLVSASAIRSASILVDRARKSNVEMFRALAVGDKMLELKMYLSSKITAAGGPVGHTDLQRATHSVIPDANTYNEIIKTLLEEQIIEAVSGPRRGQYYRIKQQPPPPAPSSP